MQSTGRNNRRQTRATMSNWVHPARLDLALRKCVKWMQRKIIRHSNSSLMNTCLKAKYFTPSSTPPAPTPHSLLSTTWKTRSLGKSGLPGLRRTWTPWNLHKQGSKSSLQLARPQTSQKRSPFVWTEGFCFWKDSRTTEYQLWFQITTKRFFRFTLHRMQQRPKEGSKMPWRATLGWVTSPP